MNLEDQKWLNEHGIFFPVFGDIIIKPTPGPGVWKVVLHPNPMDGRLGLEKVADKFDFPDKLYNTGGEDVIERVISAWNSKIYKDGNKNLGVIFNGVKGTGKTFGAKLLCNKMNLPTIIVNDCFDGKILDFMQYIDFECVVLIDEAEKTFQKDDQVLLKIIDGVYNSSRKLYILTTNRLTISENLIGRPGRIRYVKEFGTLPFSTVVEYVKDNLVDSSKSKELIEQLDKLEISTIDILRSMVEEFNIFGNLGESLLNVERSGVSYDTLRFYNSNGNADIYSPEVRTKLITIINTLCKNRAKEILYEQECLDLDEPADESPKKLTNNTVGTAKEAPEPEEKPVDEYTRIRREVYSRLRELGFSINPYRIISKSYGLYKETSTDEGTIKSEPDGDGFFVMKDRYNGDDTLYLLLGKHGAGNSIYRGLVF